MKEIKRKTELVRGTVIEDLSKIGLDGAELQKQFYRSITRCAKMLDIIEKYHSNIDKRYNAEKIGKEEWLKGINYIHFATNDIHVTIISLRSVLTMMHNQRTEINLLSQKYPLIEAELQKEKVGLKEGVKNERENS